MKYFKENTSQRVDRKQIMPKYTVGSQLIGGDVPPCSDKERRMRQIEASIRMNSNKLGRLFAHFTQEELKSPDLLKPKKEND